MDPAGAFSSASRNRPAASSRWTAFQRFAPSPMYPRGAVARDLDEPPHEPVVSLAMHGRRESDERDAHACGSAPERRPRSRLADGPRVERGVLGRDPAGRKAQRPGGQHKRAVRAGEDGAEGLDRPQVGSHRGLEIVEVVDEPQMDDAVRSGGARRQARRVVQVAAMDFCPGRREGLADASERASPTTWCPAERSSGTTAEPMNPDAPVTKTRMCTPVDVMSVADITLYHSDVSHCNQSMAATDVRCRRWRDGNPMRAAGSKPPRWRSTSTAGSMRRRWPRLPPGRDSPNAPSSVISPTNGRSCSGAPARSKTSSWTRLPARPPALRPLDAVAGALEATPPIFEARRDFARKRQTLIAAHAELQERELIKLASLGSAFRAHCATRRASPGSRPRCRSGDRHFQECLRTLARRRKKRDLAHHLREALEQLRAVTAGRTRRPSPRLGP